MNANSGGPGPEAGNAADSRTLHLARWTVSSGSNVQSRGAVVIASGSHRWEGSAEGNGPVDALYRAVDRALHDILAGHPRLLTYDAHAAAEGPDADALVTVTVGPPSSAAGRRGTGRYVGEARSANIIAASVEAYVDGLNRLLAEAHWAGAAEEAGRTRASRPRSGSKDDRAEFDREGADHDVTSWFER
jgi:hypothetical protein